MISGNFIQVTAISWSIEVTKASLYHIRTSFTSMASQRRKILLYFEVLVTLSVIVVNASLLHLSISS